METFTHAEDAVVQDLEYNRYDAAKRQTLQLTPNAESESDAEVETKGNYGVGL